MYIVENKSCKEIGKLHNPPVTDGGVRRWLIQLGIERRKVSGSDNTCHKTNSTSFQKGHVPANKTGKPRMCTDGYYREIQHGHPRATKNGYVLTHIIELEKKIGRSLYIHDGDERHPLSECGHHIDLIKTNNNWENLQLMLRRDHDKLHRDLRNANASISHNSTIN